MGKVPQRQSKAADRHASLRGVIAGIRDLIELCVTVEAPDEALVAAGRHIAGAVAARAPIRRGAGHRPPPAPTGSAAPSTPMASDAAPEHLSPLAPPLRIRWEPPRIVGEVTFGSAYEGPPGCVHGGFIAAPFDHVFSVMNVMLG